MKSELIVNVEPQQISIAILEDGKLAELQREDRSTTFAVGNVYLGRIKKIMPGLNAAFVDVGSPKDAFLHYQELGSFLKAHQHLLKQARNGNAKKGTIRYDKIKQEELPSDGSIGDYLKQGDELLVQVIKEPISTKGPRLTAEISFAGRYLILIPFGNKVSISQKISNAEERARLRQLLESIKPREFSVIVRTSAAGKRVAELDGELKSLHQRWEEHLPKLNRAKLPSIFHEENQRVVALLRDLFNPSFESIHLNDKEIFEEVKEYVHFIAPERKELVKLYRGELPLFDMFNVTKQIKSSFGRNVTFKKGAYLVIEHTEAMHVIDVNSGNRSKQSEDQESTAIDVNMAAAEEIARQLRLRDMGGIVVVDFIDMHESDNRKKLLEEMERLMENDRAKHNVLPLSKFGLMQITRQRVRPVMNIPTAEECPVCFGKGSVPPTLLFTDRLESKIDYLFYQLKVKKVKLHVHPYVAAYINQGIFSIKWRWRRDYSLAISIIPNQSLGFIDYKFYDQDNEEIDLRQEIDGK